MSEQLVGYFLQAWPTVWLSPDWCLCSAIPDWHLLSVSQWTCHTYLLQLTSAWLIP